MGIKTIKDAIIAMLKEKGSGRSFIELSEIKGFAGDQEMVVGDKNIVIWVDMSSDAISALNQMRDDKFIDIVATSELTYHADGVLLHYPIAIENKKYKESRWRPSAINKGINFSRYQ